MEDALHIAVYILAGVAAIEAGALVVLSRLLARSRQELDELRQRTDARTWLLSGGREAVKTVWNTANLVRKQGFGAADACYTIDCGDGTGTSCCGSVYSSGFRSTPRMTVKTAVLPPIPSANVRTAAIVKALFFRMVRSEYRTSCQAVSRKIKLFIRYTSSRIEVGFPSFLRAAAYPRRVT